MAGHLLAGVLVVELAAVSGEADARAVVEEDADGPVRQLEAEAVLVGVVDPLGDEERLDGHRRRIGRRCATKEERVNHKPRLSVGAPAARWRRRGLDFWLARPPLDDVDEASKNANQTKHRKGQEKRAFHSSVDGLDDFLLILDWPCRVLGRVSSSRGIVKQCFFGLFYERPLVGQRSPLGRPARRSSSGFEERKR